MTERTTMRRHSAGASSCSRDHDDRLRQSRRYQDDISCPSRDRLDSVVPAATGAKRDSSTRRFMRITETEWIWHDGEFVPWAEANVHVLCHSLQFGSSAFEGVRCYSTPRGPAIFRLEDHLKRLINSCKIYRMDVQYSVDDLVAACCELVERNALDACYLRPMVIRGYGAAGMVPFDSPIEVYLPCWPWGTYLGEGALENGIDACVSTWHRMAPNTTPAFAKSAGHYIGGQLAQGGA